MKESINSKENIKSKFSTDGQMIAVDNFVEIYTLSPTQHHFEYFLGVTASVWRTC